MSRWGKKKKEDPAAEVYPSVIEGLKKIYATKIKPLEQLYQFDEFYSPLLKDSDFDAKPMVLLLGQYSTGKTTFIRYLLERDFPGIHIGPEPTTDRFIAIMYGKEELVTPGNALSVQADKPFTALGRFGMDFLNKFQGSHCPAPILEDLTFIDTPGVLSGEKQRIGRSYDFPKITEWFAERSDMILLLFDAHKLDISDEFKRVIESLKGHEEKVRVVLNKADQVTAQQLMRVYGALMWSLGKVLGTPEVMRVYIGSFWDKPYHIDDCKTLFEAEQNDLLKDLYGLPRFAAIRKVNDLVKRARLAKVHAYLVSYLRDQMPIFGKDSKKESLINNMREQVFLPIHKQYQLPVGDFPQVKAFQDKLKQYDFSKFAKLNQKLIEAMDTVLGQDVPRLMQLFPAEQRAKTSTNPFDGNPFESPLDAGPIEPDDRARWLEQFQSLSPVDGRISGASAK